MDARPEPSSLDSDSGEEEEEDWLDPSEKQDGTLLSSVLLSGADLLLDSARPSSSRLRHGGAWRAPSQGTRDRRGHLAHLAQGAQGSDKAYQGRAGEGPDRDLRVSAPACSSFSARFTDVSPAHSPSSQIIDVNLVKGIGRVCQRLEAAAAAIVNPLRWEEDIAPTESAELALARRKAVIHPTSLAYPIRPDSSDEELAALLEGYLQRIENVLSTLTLHRLGPYTGELSALDATRDVSLIASSNAEVLAALGAAVKTDPRSILNALSRFAAAMH